MNGLMKFVVAVLVAGPLSSPLAAQEPNAEIAAVRDEWVKLHNAGQYDAAIAVAQKRLRLTEQVHGIDSPQAANAANTLALSYHGKRDLTNAEIHYRRALTGYEKLGLVKDNWPLCRTLNSLSDVAYARLDMESAARLAERALSCSESLLGPADSMTRAHLFDLMEAYNYPSSRPDLAAKADLLAQRWVPTLERVKGVDHIDVARLLREQGRALATRNDRAGAKAMRKRALAIAATQRDPAKPDGERLALEERLLLDLTMAYRTSEIDADYAGYQARRLAILERTKGAGAPETVALRGRVAELRARFPEPSAAAPVRQAAVTPAPVAGGSDRIEHAPPSGATGKPVWPAGMETGNLYFVVSGNTDGTYKMEDALPIMVAAADAAEAVERVRAAHLQSLRGGFKGRTVHARVIEAGECKGPVWGAVAANSVEEKKGFAWGGGCGKTPAQAIEAAFAACRKKGPVNCDTVGTTYRERRQVVLALSGRSSWSGYYCVTGCIPSPPNNFGSYNAFSEGPYDLSEIRGEADAIAKLGKACGGQPCYLTTTTVRCFDETAPDVRVAKCTDARLTRQGYSGPIR